MLVIIKRFIKDRKLTLLIYCLATIGFLWMYIVLFPSIKESFSDLQKMMHAFPEEMLKAFGFELDSFGTFEGYIGSEQYTFIWPIMMIALSASLAGNALAGEVERGTSEILLSQPISRLKLFFSRYIAGAIAIFIFILASVGSVFPMTIIYDITMKTGNFLKLGLLGFVFAMAIYSMSMFFSAIFSEKGKANFAPTGILVMMYVINIISGLQSNLESLKYTSFFYYFSPSKCLIRGEVNHLSWIVFSSAIIIFTGLAAYIFNKKDISR